MNLKVLPRIFPISATVILMFKVGLLSTHAFAFEPGKYDLQSGSDRCTKSLTITGDIDNGVKVEELELQLKGINSGTATKDKDAGNNDYSGTSTYEEDTLKLEVARSYYTGKNDPYGHETGIPDHSTYTFKFVQPGGIETKAEFSGASDDNSTEPNEYSCKYAFHTTYSKSN